MVSPSNQMPVNSEQLHAITKELDESSEFQETLRRVLTPGNSRQPPSRISAPTFSNVEKREGLAISNHQKTASTTKTNQHRQATSPKITSKAIQAELNWITIVIFVINISSKR